LKNVYLVNLSFGLAGIERRFANVWRALRRRGVVFPILVVPSSLAALLDEAGLLPADREGLIVTPEPAWIRRMRLPASLAIPAAIVRSRIAAMGYRPLWSRIASDPSAVVHIGMNTSALRPPDTPAVYECVDANLEQLDTRHLRRAAKRRCIVHCQTERIRAALDSIFAARAPRWRTVASPMYFAQYDDWPGDAVRDERLAVFVGRLAPEKNPLLFIDAVARVRAEGLECRAVMLGEGPLRAECESRIREHGLQGAIRIDFVPKPAEVLRRAAVCVTLQPGDNYGSQALLEAMGAGCAIVASDVGETKKLVTEDVGIRTALNTEAVAGALKQLIGSPMETRRLGSAAAHMVRISYSADAYASFLESVYDLAGEHHRRADEDCDALAGREMTTGCR
jgi:glycosyltransferase involved in cell wall biosynthesis